MAKKKQIKPSRKPAPITSFVIKAPRWAWYVCVGATLVGILGISIFLVLKSAARISQETFEFIYLFALFLVLGCVGIYACYYEKFILQDDVYTYYKPFLKNQSAAVEEIAYVELITVCSWGTRGYREDYRVRFYGHDGKILLKCFDDGTVFKNQDFIRSLKTNHIKMKHITKEL